MATLLKQDESQPAAYNLLPSAALAAVAWQRVESYIAHRFSPRDVTWVVEGPGPFVPPLKPATIATVEVWSRGADEWETADLNASPLGGYYLPCTGPYRFTAAVGSAADEAPPAGVQEAVKRLAAYLTNNPGKAGATFESISIGGALTKSVRRSESWMASALQNSGAADLLRGYRNV